MVPCKLYLATLSISSYNIHLPPNAGIFSPQSGQRAQAEWSKGKMKLAASNWQQAAFFDWR